MGILNLRSLEIPSKETDWQSSVRLDTTVSRHIRRASQLFSLLYHARAEMAGWHGEWLEVE